MILITRENIFIVEDMLHGAPQSSKLHKSSIESRTLKLTVSLLKHKVCALVLGSQMSSNHFNIKTRMTEISTEVHPLVSSPPLNINMLGYQYSDVQVL